MIRYSIMGRYHNNEEEIDNTDSQSEAEDMYQEYRLAFGNDWTIWVETYEQ